MTADVRREGDPWWLTALGVIAVILLFAGAAGGVLFAVRQMQSARSTPATIESETLGDPRFGDVFAAFRSAYPEEFAALRDRIAAERQAGAADLALQRMVGEHLSSTARRNRGNLVQAPGYALTQLEQAELQMLQAMARENASECGGYVVHGRLPTNASPEVMQTVVAMSAETWHAHAAGRQEPAGRQFSAEPRDEDAVALVAGLRALGVADNEMIALDEPRLLSSMTPEQQCDLSIKLTQALLAMPPEQGARTVAWIISRKP